MSTGPDDGVPIATGVWLPTSEVQWRFSTSGGPGGQHVNTANTKAEATFDVARSPTLPEWARDRIVATLGPVVTVTASDTRSQARNRDLALARLAGRLARALEVRPPRRPTRPSASARRRRLEGKRHQSERKADRRWRPDDH